MTVPETNNRNGRNSACFGFKSYSKPACMQEADAKQGLAVTSPPNSRLSLSASLPRSLLAYTWEMQSQAWLLQTVSVNAIKQAPLPLLALSAIRSLLHSLLQVSPRASSSMQPMAWFVQSQHACIQAFFGFLLIHPHHSLVHVAVLAKSPCACVPAHLISACAL